MFKSSIDSKPFFTKPDGTKVRDLTQGMFNLKTRDYIAYNVYRVPKDYVMRPDLISKAVYNNSLYAEIILKYNGISNPFSINEGDLILIPDLDSAKSKIKDVDGTQGSNAAERIRNSYKYIDPLKKPTAEDRTKVSKFTDRQIVDIAGGSLPPNVADEGASQLTYRNGRVYFREGAETCLKNGLSTSEFLTNVIKNKKNNGR